MTNRYFSLEEFKALFPDRFGSREEMLREYVSFLSILDQLEETPVPELSARAKAEIFRGSWRQRSYEWSRLWAWLAFIRRPAVTFTMGLVLGCALTAAALGHRIELAPPTGAADEPLTIEHVGHTQTYTGKVIDGLYPQIENPKIVLERTNRSAPKRVLYGTVNKGDIYVVWNL